MVRALKRLIGAERGAALVEFTVLMPLLFALMAGFIEFGMAMQRHHLVQKSLRDSTRYLAQVPGFDSTTPIDATPCNDTPDGPGPDRQESRHIRQYRRHRDFKNRRLGL